MTDNGAAKNAGGPGVEMQIAVFNQPRPRILLVSHERSGSHFLMNGLCLCYGYHNRPPINLDHTVVGINFYSSDLVRYLLRWKEYNLATILKSHHSIPFFEGDLEQILDVFTIFYIYRDPRDVMLSYWNFLNKLDWTEGPKLNSCTDLMRAQPMGQMMRYQFGQYPTILHRWRDHVDGWLDTARQEQSGRIVTVKYEDLHMNFERVMRSFENVLGRPPKAIVRPRPDVDVVVPSSGRIGDHKAHFTPEDHDWVRHTVGDTMQRLGYA